MKTICILLITLTALTATYSLHAAGINSSAKHSGLSVDDSIACNISVPDMVTDFSGARSNDYIILSWVIQEQNDSAAFTIEKSTDGNNWQAYASVPAHGGSASPAVYFYGDAHAGAVNYYRLKQATSSDGAVYSTTVKVAGTEKKNRGHK